MSKENEDRLIDIERVISEKFKGKKVPKFVVKFLKKLLHEDFINSVISQTSADGIAFCRESLDLLGIKVDVYGLENVPSDGSRYTFASNHPLGGADGIALCSIIGSRYGGIKMLVNDFLLFMKPIAPMCVPVNKVGGQSRKLPMLVDEAYSSDNQLLIFPAGLCSRKINGEIKDLPWGKSFVSKSVQYGRKIVPVHFIGHNSNRFYFVAKLCKVLRLKFNIAMLFLPDEMYRARGSRFSVVFGKPIPCEYFDSSKSPAGWASYLRTLVYNIKPYGENN